MTGYTCHKHCSFRVSEKIVTVLTQQARGDTKMCINYVGITFNELHNKTAKTLKTTTKQVRVNFPFSFLKEKETHLSTCS